MTAHRNPITSWLLDEGWQLSHDDFLWGLVQTYLKAGVPVSRVRLNARLLHPQVLGYAHMWTEGSDEIEYFEASHEIAETAMYRNSPYAAIFEENAGAIRRRLSGTGVVLDYPILIDLKQEGYTDYVALPLIFSDGRRSAITIATCHENGFSTDMLKSIYNSLPALARIVENFALRRTASVLLETYLGRETGRQVLSGKVRRGDGQRIKAVIWFSDLRRSTTLAETMAHDDFLDLLNAYFDCTAGSVLEHGGEVLRYIGDAVLAIFPLPSDGNNAAHQEAAQKADRAMRQTFKNLEDLNAGLTAKGTGPIEIGIGLHVGEVMYGNIGTTNRLEFSVIGSSANEASRLESMTKELGVPLVVSEQFRETHGGEWQSLGYHALRGFQDKRPLFTQARTETMA